MISIAYAPRLVRGVQSFRAALLDPADTPRDFGIELDWFLNDV